mgnify:CR=1 FL=1
MIEKYGASEDDEEKLDVVYYRDYLASFDEEMPVNSGNEIKVVTVEGVIMGGDVTYGTAGSDGVVAMIKEAHEDEDTKEGIIKEEVPMEDSDDETPLARRKKPQKRKSDWDEDSEDEPLSKKKAKKKKKGRKKAWEEHLKALAEAEDELNNVSLGDASVASPFTSRVTSIRCTKDVLQRGRCTLVTMLQIYKILGVNCSL